MINREEPGGGQLFIAVDFRNRVGAIDRLSRRTVCSLLLGWSCILQCLIRARLTSTGLGDTAGPGCPDVHHCSTVVLNHEQQLSDPLK
jgi:hypothetical protein